MRAEPDTVLPGLGAHSVCVNSRGLLYWHCLLGSRWCPWGKQATEYLFSSQHIVSILCSSCSLPPNMIPHLFLHLVVCCFKLLAVFACCLCRCSLSSASAQVCFTACHVSLSINIILRKAYDKRERVPMLSCLPFVPSFCTPCHLPLQNTET